MRLADLKRNKPLEFGRNPHAIIEQHGPAEVWFDPDRGYTYVPVRGSKFVVTSDAVKPRLDCMRESGPLPIWHRVFHGRTRRAANAKRSDDDPGQLVAEHSIPEFRNRFKFLDLPRSIRKAA